MIEFFKRLIENFKHKQAMKKRLKALKSRDPFIYK